MDLSLVIPACNEERRIGETLVTYAEHLRASGISFEIIVEMDGCTDGTSTVVRNLSDVYFEIRELEFEDKLGKGGGLIKGFGSARGNHVGFVDADGSIPPGELLKLLAEAQKGTDLVIASRRAKGAHARYKSRSRRVLSKCFNILVRLMFALPYKDTQCGAKVMRKEALVKTLSGVHANGFAFDVFLIYLAKKNGYSIKEVGIDWEDKVGSKVNILHTTLDMLSSLVKLRIFFSPFRSLLAFKLGGRKESIEWIESP